MKEMTEWSWPLMMWILSKLMSLQSGLMYVWPGGFSIISFIAAAGSALTVSRSERVPPSSVIEAVLTMLRMARDGSNRANIKLTRGR